MKQKTSFGLTLLASLYLSFCTPIANQTPSPLLPTETGKNSPEEEGSKKGITDMGEVKKREHHSFFEQEQKILHDAAQSCSDRSFPEKVAQAYRNMLEKKPWNENDHCPEYYYEDVRPGWKAFIAARQPYQTSCVTAHEQEIAEDKQRILEGRSPFSTKFHLPVQAGIEIGMGNNDPMQPKMSVAIFPDVYNKPEYYEQYALDLETLELISCNFSPVPPECSLLPVKETLQGFCTAITATEMKKK